MDPRLDTGGWLNPYAGTSQHLLPTGTFTLQDTPSFARRDINLGHLPDRDAQKKQRAAVPGQVHPIVR